MLSPRWRKVLSDLWGNKTRTLLVVASIAVGVFAIGLIAGAYVNISEGVRDSYAAAQPANIVITADPMPRDLADDIARIEGVAAAEGRQRVSVRVRLADGSWDALTIEAIRDFETMQINLLLPSSGSPIPTDDEILLERKTQQNLGVAVGDEIEIELPDGDRRLVRVAGASLDATTGEAAIIGELKGFVTLDALEWMHLPDSVNWLYATVEGDRSDTAWIETVATRINDRLEASGRTVYRTEMQTSEQHPIGNIIDALLKMLALLGVLVVLLSGFLITNTMSALLSQHMRQIGIMKLVGARGGQVVVMYLVLMVIYGLLALAISIPLGAIGARALSAFVADLVNYAPIDHPIIPQAVVIQTFVALLVPPAAGLWPVLKGSRVSVQEALHTTGTSEEASSGLLTRLLSQLRSLSRPLLISIRNTFRRKGRLALTLVTLTLGGAIFIAVFNTQSSLDVKMERIGRYFGGDVNVDLAQDYRVEQIERYLLAVPGVQSVEAWTTAGAEIVHTDGRPSAPLSLIAPPGDTTLVEPDMLQGRWLNAEDTNSLAVNEAFLTRYPNLQVGDVLRLKLDGKERDWNVVGLFEYTGLDDLIAYANYDYVARVTHRVSQAASYRVIISGVGLEDQTQVARAIDEALEARDIRIAKVEAGDAYRGSISDLLGILTTVLLVMALLTALVGSIGLAGTMSMNVLERTREIGVLRAIGAHNGIVSNLVIVEGLLIGLVSYLLAALLSFPITWGLSNVISQAIFASAADGAYTLVGYGVWLVVVGLLSVVSSLWPARNASRLTIREVLAYE